MTWPRALSRSRTPASASHFAAKVPAKGDDLLRPGPWAKAETQPSPEAPGRAIMDYLEERFVKGGEEVKELISLSFLELLPSETEPGSGLRDLLGPELSSEAKRVA